MTASPTAASTAAPTPARRAPLPVRAAAALTVPLVGVSGLGLTMFGVVWNDDLVSPSLVFTVVALVGLLTALAALPSLLRGDRAGWLLSTGWAAAYSYWSVYKVFVEEEFESTPFLVAGVLVCALLLTRGARRHADLV